jgi:hypothetical protein
VIGVASLALLITLTVGCAAQTGNVPGTGSSTSPVEHTTSAPGDMSPSSSPTEPPPAPLPTPSPDESVIFVTYGVDGNSVYASGIVPDRVDQSGTCTLTATAGGDTLSADLEAGPTPTTMNCGEIRVSVPAGEWNIRITYTSGTYTGHSGEVTVTVP